MSSDQQRPIIIKRKKVVGGGHHGGAWKVAYADFVTAMMAFFMLMWLLGATTDDQRKGLADYFTPTVAVSRTTGGGDGAFGGETQTAARSATQDGSGGITTTELQGFGSGAEAEAEGALQDVAEAILGRGGDSVVEDRDRRNVTIRLTDAGLVIEMFDLPGSPLFEPGNGGAPSPTPLLRRLLATVAGQAMRTEGGVAIEAHVASTPLVRRDNSAWDESLARAQALRGAIVRAGLDPDRLRRVTGHGDRTIATEPAIAARNNRVEVVLLRPDA